MSTTRKSAVVLIVAVLVFAVLALVLTGGSDSASVQIRPTTTKQVDEKKAQRQQAQRARMREQAFAVSVYQGETWKCQRNLGVARTRGVSAWSLPRSIRIRSKIIRFWRAEHGRCQKLTEWRIIPTTGNWVTAVKLVQRIYPNTDDWLLSCSAHEGGHGGWVPNRQGSGADGWMQFMSGTFYAYQDRAFREARRRGFVVDRTWQSWYHPLGQAITAAYMRTIGISHYHWDPGVDPYCR